MSVFEKIYEMTAFSHLASAPASIFMLLLALLILYLGIFKKYEPLLLVPIGFGVLLANFPGGNMSVVSTQMVPEIKHMTIVAVSYTHLTLPTTPYV